MTEFEAAYTFVKEYAEAVAFAVIQNERLDDWSEYSRYCEGLRLPPTRERLCLARDIAIAAREYFSGTEAEHGLLVVDAGVGAGELNDVPLLFVVDSLECYGWRADYLEQNIVSSWNADD